MTIKQTMQRDEQLNLAMNIVNNLGDLWKVPVGTRQATNDEADILVRDMIANYFSSLRKYIEVHFPEKRDNDWVDYNQAIDDCLAVVKEVLE